VTAFAATLSLVAGCQTAPKNETARANLQDQAATTLRRFERSDSSIARVLDHAPGCVVFPEVGKGGFIVGGGYGKGVVYQAGAPVGYADMTEATLGWQAGGQSFSELIVFQDQDTLHKFKGGGWGLGAEASAVAIKPGAAAQAEFKHGVMVFTLTNAGLMAEAAVAGQKFRYSNGGDMDNGRIEAGTASDRRDANLRNGVDVNNPPHHEVDVNVDANRRATDNVSGSASVSTPNGDRNVSGKSSISGSASISTPGGGDTAAGTKDRKVNADVNTNTTTGTNTTTTETERRTTTDNGNTTTTTEERTTNK
jgi:lipid-binding SYLF domain-containing protein